MASFDQHVPGDPLSSDDYDDLLPTAGPGVGGEGDPPAAASDGASDPMALLLQAVQEMREMMGDVVGQVSTLSERVNQVETRALPGLPAASAPDSVSAEVDQRAADEQRQRQHEDEERQRAEEAERERHEAEAEAARAEAERQAQLLAAQAVRAVHGAEVERLRALEEAKIQRAEELDAVIEKLEQGQELTDEDRELLAAGADLDLDVEGEALEADVATPAAEAAVVDHAPDSELSDDDTQADDDPTPSTESDADDSVDTLTAAQSSASNDADQPRDEPDSLTTADDPLAVEANDPLAVEADDPLADADDSLAATDDMQDLVATTDEDDDLGLDAMIARMDEERVDSDEPVAAPTDLETATAGDDDLDLEAIIAQMESEQDTDSADPVAEVAPSESPAEPPAAADDPDIAELAAELAADDDPSDVQDPQPTSAADADDLAAILAEMEAEDAAGGAVDEAPAEPMPVAAEAAVPDSEPASQSVWQEQPSAAPPVEAPEQPATTSADIVPTDLIFAAGDEGTGEEERIAERETFEKLAPKREEIQLASPPAKGGRKRGGKAAQVKLPDLPLQRIERGRPLVIAVASPKGGVGKSTTSVGLASEVAAVARSLADRAASRGDGVEPQRVLVMDGDVANGNLAVRFGVDLRPNLYQFYKYLNDYGPPVTYGDPLDGQAPAGNMPSGATQGMSDFVHFPSTLPNLNLLAAPENPQEFYQFSTEDYERILSVLGQFYDVIVIDCGTEIVMPSNRVWLRAAHQVFLLTMAELAALHSARRFYDLVSSPLQDDSGHTADPIVNREKLNVVMMRATKDFGIDPKWAMDQSFPKVAADHRFFFADFDVEAGRANNSRRFLSLENQEYANNIAQLVKVAFDRYPTSARV